MTAGDWRLPPGTKDGPSPAHIGLMIPFKYRRLVAAMFLARAREEGNSVVARDELARWLRKAAAEIMTDAEAPHG